MRYHVLACDYDGTLAHHGVLDAATAGALARLRTTGRRVVMVTGRRLDDLESACPDLEPFDLVVAENGALLYTPASKEVTALAPPPDDGFVQALRARGVTDLAVGAAIVATWEPHAQAIFDAIRELGLELQVIFNKGAVMVLPSGVNKATGLAAALARLGISPHNTIAVGDAENDHAMLASVECGVAVANALPALRERADLVTTADHGAGVAELCERLAASDLAELAPALVRHDLPLGRRLDTDAEIFWPAYGSSLLIAGTSGGGKSTAVTGLGERMAEHGYQHVIIDPEGDYGSYDPAIVLDDAHRAPTIDEVKEVLARPDANLVINLVGLTLELRPAFFGTLLPVLRDLRARLGRPHFVIVDEAHHLIPAARGDSAQVAADVSGLVLVTVHPEHVMKSTIAAVDWAMAIGKTPAATLREFADAGGTRPPAVPDEPLPPGEALVWRRGDSAPPARVRPSPSSLEKKRHVRKYAEGDLGPDKSFYFRGPDGKLNLRAQNLQLFLQVGDGVDEDTWFHHLRGGDYSKWARDSIKDETLAAELAEIERGAAKDEDAAPSRTAVRRAIEARYTAPA